MDYVLYVYGSALFVAVYAAVWTVGGQSARIVLSLGAYTLHPRYEPPSRSWRRAQAGHHRDRAREQQSWTSYLGGPAVQTPERGYESPAAPAYDVPVRPGHLPPLLVQAETPLAGLLLSRRRIEEAEIDGPGAEHWGSLLVDMNTEERQIYSLELVVAYEETKAVERPFLAGLDETIARFTRDLDELGRRQDAVIEGSWGNFLRRHGGEERWRTGQYVLVSTGPDTA